MNSNPHSLRSGVPRRILGGLISVTVAWLILQLVMVVVFAIQARPFPLWVDAMYFAIGSLPFVLIPGLVIFLPLYVFIPPNSILWHWPICTGCGVAFGVALIFLLSFPNPHSFEVPFEATLAGVTGGVTCLFASLTMAKFHFRKPSHEGFADL